MYWSSYINKSWKGKKQKTYTVPKKKKTRRLVQVRSVLTPKTNRVEEFSTEWTWPHLYQKVCFCAISALGIVPQRYNHLFSVKRFDLSTKNPMKARLDTLDEISLLRPANVYFCIPLFVSSTLFFHLQSFYQWSESGKHI